MATPLTFSYQLAGGLSPGFLKGRFYFPVYPEYGLLLEQRFIPVTETVDLPRDRRGFFVKINDFISGFGDQFFAIGIKPVAGYVDYGASFFEHFADVRFLELIPFFLGDHFAGRFGLAEIEIRFHHSLRGAGKQDHKDT
jgi:hypothetical protein